MQRTILALLLGFPLIQGCDHEASLGGDYADVSDIEMVPDLPEAEDKDPTRLPGANDADIEGGSGSGGETGSTGDDPEDHGMQCQFWDEEVEELDSPVTCPTWCELHTWDVEGLDVDWYALDCEGYFCLLQENSYGPWYCYPGSCKLNLDEVTSSCEIEIEL